MSRFSPITHVLFDLDGLILDTETMNLKIFSEIATRYGISDVPAEIKERVLGRTEKDASELFVHEMNIPVSVDEFRKIRRSMSRKRIGSIRLLPGAERLIFHLKDSNVPFGLATSSHYESVSFKLANFRHIFQSFSLIVSGMDDPEVARGKPAPDIFLVAASRFPDKPDPKECLVFEDSPSGVTAGISAGMQVVMVPNPELLLGNPELTKNATLVLESLSDFKPESFGLPPFPN